MQQASRSKFTNRPWLPGRQLAAAASALLLSVAIGCGGSSSEDSLKPHAAWATAQVDYSDHLPMLPAPESESFSDQTLRQIVRVSIGGDKVRVKFSNLFGTAPLTIDAAHVALRTSGSEIDPTTDTPLTFSGSSHLTVASGAEAWSDPVSLQVKAQDDLAISAYIAGSLEKKTTHTYAKQTNYAGAGNQVAASSISTPVAFNSWYNLAEVDVYSAQKTHVVVAFGDSITDGYGTLDDMNTRWTDYFAQRIQAAPGNGAVSVVNTGISGSRILSDTVGPNGLDRFERDVLNRTGVTHVVLLHGANDIFFESFTDVLGIPGFSPGPSADEIVNGITQYVDLAKAKGLKVFVSTLTPSNGFLLYSPATHTRLDQINAILRSDVFRRTVDGLLEFDTVLGDSSDPTALATDYDSGDHVHPNAAGNEAMAASIPLAPFQVQ